MNDSISRKQLLKIMSDWQMEIARVGNEREYDILEKVIRCICKQPSVYDEDKIIHTSSKTPSRQEAQKILRSCGILNNQII